MKTLIIDPDPTCFQSIELKVSKNYPQLNILGYASDKKEALEIIKKDSPSVIFINIDMPADDAVHILQDATVNQLEKVFISHTMDRAVDAIKYQASGYLLKPFQIDEVFSAIKLAEKRIEAKSKDVNICVSLPDNVIGIPTLEGYDFFKVEDIIRCEGYQRCTRIITVDRSDIISSYHLGVFKKKLERYPFFCTHKSHLIHLIHIKKYLKEGSIKMADDSYVPVSKRRKADFLKLLNNR